MNRFLRTRAILTVAALTGGCATITVADSIDDKPLRLIFITTCIDEAFFKPVIQGMNDAADCMGVACTFTGTRGVDVPAQAAMVRQAVADGYDGIALNIVDPEGFDAVVAEAIDAGVPVVAFNVDDHATPNRRLSAIHQQLEAAGRTLAERAAPDLPRGSHVLMTLHDENVSALDDRLRGAQQVLERQGVTWSVLVTGRDPEIAATRIAEALQHDPRLKTVLCTGQADTEGAGRAIRKHFANQKYWAAGFDLSPEILRSIQTGDIRFTIDQQPYAQGFYPVVQLTLYKRFGIVPSSIDAGAAIIDSSNVDQVIDLNKKHFR